MDDQHIIKYGDWTFRVTAAWWDSNAQKAIINYQDALGVPFQVEGFGMAWDEIRQAVVDDVIERTKSTQRGPSNCP